MDGKTHGAGVTRRELVRRALVAGGAVALPAIVPAAALGRGNAVAPSDRIVLGGIGLGPRGQDVLRSMLVERDVQFVATCDIRADRRQSVKAMADNHYGNRDCAMYRDLRELLARPDIDAILVATGDRWHGPASILAAKAGKDVFAEKPCALSIGLCQALDDTFRRYGRVFQAGTQRRSVPNFQAAVRLAHTGKLGRLHTLHASLTPLSIARFWLPAQPEPPRDEIDWDLWLGPAPWRPYNRTYVDGGWRGHHDFVGGAEVLEWGSHTVDLCQWANQSDDAAPVEYEAEGQTIHARYANGVKLLMRQAHVPWVQGAVGEGWIPGLGTCPVRFEGDEGWVETGDNGIIEVHPKSLRAELEGVRRIAGTDAAGHGRNFLDCVRSGAQPACNAKVMRHGHIACHAAGLAWQLGRKMRFDPATETFTGDAEANRLRHRAMREPWRV
ncbi:MAG TPA: Gfo/Idh/MocA family oxidoreductase [Chthonomonadales bacterium]|nr:Gfo/Idh/MocA family oxidoreductase [Chthonomonadales bacterium]